MRHRRRFHEWCGRLSKMGWDEWRTRINQQAAKTWDSVVRVGASFREENYDPSLRSLGRFFFAPANVPTLCRLLRERRPETVDTIIAQAEDICGHRFDLLGYRQIDYGTNIDWHLDGVHGKKAPCRPWFFVPYLDFDQVGDAKIIWELSRHQHLVTLAKAYRLTGKVRYVTELVTQWYDWQDQNSYGVGINWASSLEVAFRSLSWIWVLQLLKECDAVPLAFPGDVHRALLMNARHIERFLSTYFSPNTHLLGEGVGLFFIGVLTPGSSRASLWREKGWRIVLEEAVRQVQPDGMHFEQSTYYHVYALDFFLHARILAGANGVCIPPALDRTLDNMLNVLASLAKPGPVPNFGDDDGGRVFDPRRNEREQLTDPLSVGAALFNRAQWKDCAEQISEEAIWLLGAEGVNRFSELRADCRQSGSSALASSGIYVMRGSMGSQQLVVDAGPQSAGRPGHGHADALSVQVAVNGRMTLVDPGTSAYVDENGERDRFRNSAGHNTVLIDGLSQSDPAGPFGWRDLPKVNVNRWIVGNSFDLFTGSHGGYTRLPDPVVHQRHIFYLRDKFWLVRDVLIGEEKHEFQSSWHCAPGELSAISGGAQYSCDGTSVFVLGAGPKTYAQKILQSDISPVYGRKVVAPLLQFAGLENLPTEFATLLLPCLQLKGAPGIFSMVGEPSRDSVLHAYVHSTVTEESYFVFCDEPTKWETGPWASDAAFVYCRLGEKGSVVQFVLCHGSYLEFRGTPIFGSPTVVSQAEWCQNDAIPECHSSSEAVGLRPPPSTNLPVSSLVSQ